MVIVALGMTLILVFGTQALAGPTNVSFSMSQGATLQGGLVPADGRPDRDHRV